MVGRRLFTALLVIGALSIAIRVPFLSVPLITDEGGYAYTAHWMLRGLALYRDLWFDRPQGTFVIYAGFLRLFGESVEAIRLGAAVYNALTVLAIGWLGRRLFGPIAGVAAAGLFAISSASPQAEGFTANGELLMNLPVVVALLLATQRRWILAGMVCALAFVIKPTALASVAPPLLILAATTENERRQLAALRLTKIGIGGVAGLLPFVLHGVLIDPPGYWYAVVGFRVEAHSAFSVGGALLREFGTTAPSLLLALLPLWLLAGAALFLGGGSEGAQESEGLWSRPEKGVTIGAALLAGGFAGAAAGGYWYWHYYVGLFPGACLLGGHALAALAERANGRRSAVAALACATVAAVGFNARLVGATPQETSWRLYQRPSYLVNQALADYVRSHTVEDDQMYAAFAEAELYHLARRRSVGRQLYWTEINRVPGALERVLETLDDPLRRPTYVVAIDRELEQEGRAAPFWERVKRYYQEETAIQGFSIFRAQRGPTVAAP